MKLIYFTTSFPYGLQQQWKISELRELKKKFDEIIIIPHIYTGKEFTESFEGIEVKSPFFSKSPFLKPGRMLHLLSPRFFFYLEEFLTKKVYRSKKKLMSFLNSTNKIELMLSSPMGRQLMKMPDKKDTVLYFYWGVGSSLIVPFLKGFKKVVVRFHGYDLYEDRNAGYIPFRKPLLKNISNAVFISGHGLNYIQTRYPELEVSKSLFRLGSNAKGQASMSGDNILRIVSCSSIKDIKRVDMILDSLHHLTFPVEWLHIGGGEGLESLKIAAKKLPSNIIARFTGHVESDKVLDYYVDKSLDVFVNVSTTEGVPVSIMEALSAGIPILATDVGGTKEIVDEKVGILLPAALNHEDLARYLETFYRLSVDQKLELRRNALERFRDSCNSCKLNASFAEFLVNN